MGYRIPSKISKFLSVGLLAYIVNIGLFNLLIISGILKSKPVSASIISTLISILVAYYGNRFYTFSEPKRNVSKASALKFFLINFIALSFSAVILGITHYVLHIHSLLVDNIAANILGIGLGTIFRYYAYNKFIFKEVVQ